MRCYLPAPTGAGVDHRSWAAASSRDPRWVRLTLPVAIRSDGPTSSTSSSTTVRFSPLLVSKLRCLSRPGPPPACPAAATRRRSRPPAATPSSAGQGVAVGPLVGGPAEGAWCRHGGERRYRRGSAVPGTSVARRGRRTRRCGSRREVRRQDSAAAPDGAVWSWRFLSSAARVGAVRGGGVRAVGVLVERALPVLGGFLADVGVVAGPSRPHAVLTGAARALPKPG